MEVARRCGLGVKEHGMMRWLRWKLKLKMELGRRKERRSRMALADPRWQWQWQWQSGHSTIGSTLSLFSQSPLKAQLHGVRGRQNAADYSAVRLYSQPLPLFFCLVLFLPPPSEPRSERRQLFRGTRNGRVASTASSGHTPSE